MAKRPPPGRCVHCLGTFESLTWDHGIPLSWYPDGVVVEKPKAPSCQDCQSSLARVERNVLLPLAICLDPTDPLTYGIPQAAMRSIDPAMAGKPGMTPNQVARDQRARLKLRWQVQSRLFVPKAPIHSGALPGFGVEHANGTSTAILGPHRDELTTIGDKFVRVAVWVMRNGQFIESNMEVETYVAAMEDVRDVAELVRQGDALDIFPGIRLTLATAGDEPTAHFALFELWGRLTLFVSVTPKDSTQQLSCGDVHDATRQ